jgi:hypothetical protein
MPMQKQSFHVWRCGKDHRARGEKREGALKGQIRFEPSGTLLKQGRSGERAFEDCLLEARDNFRERVREELSNSRPEFERLHGPWQKSSRWIAIRADQHISPPFSRTSNKKIDGRRDNLGNQLDIWACSGIRCLCLGRR